MNWLWWVGGGTAVVAALGAALYFFGLGGVAKVARSVFGALGDFADTVRSWLREPGNKTRGLCAVLALLFLGAGMQSWQRGTVIVQQRQDFTDLKTRTDAQAATYRKQIAARDRTIKQFMDLAERQKALLARAKLENAEALAAARKAQARAAASQKQFQDVFLKRPPECRAALEVMAAACPTLTDY